MYSSIFAAIGAAVDSEQDSQQFMTPVMLPILLGYMLNFRIAEAPDSTIAIVASLFPLTSPINMVTRMLVSNVSFWEVTLFYCSIDSKFDWHAIISGTNLQNRHSHVWKEPSFKELFKWLKQA